MEYESITANWTVPNVQAPPSGIGGYDSAVWVGFDGYAEQTTGYSYNPNEPPNSGLIQLGTTQYMSCLPLCQAVYQAFWEIIPYADDATNYPAIDLGNGFPVAPGQNIQATLTVGDPTSITFSFYNLSTLLNVAYYEGDAINTRDTNGGEPLGTNKIPLQTADYIIEWPSALFISLFANYSIAYMNNASAVEIERSNPLFQLPGLQPGDPEQMHDTWSVTDVCSNKLSVPYLVDQYSIWFERGISDLSSVPTSC